MNSLYGTIAIFNSKRADDTAKAADRYGLFRFGRFKSLFEIFTAFGKTVQRRMIINNI